jgi:hypothetical protein
MLKRSQRITSTRAIVETLAEVQRADRGNSDGTQRRRRGGNLVRKDSVGVTDKRYHNRKSGQRSGGDRRPDVLLRTTAATAVIRRPLGALFRPAVTGLGMDRIRAPMAGAETGTAARVCQRRAHSL